MRSYFLNELTTPDIEAYLKGGGRTALLPVGSVEMHGPHQPVGTDTLIAKAFSLELAKAVNGLVFPEVHYTWAGATDGFAGTISLPVDLAQQMVYLVAGKAVKMGFDRFVAVSVHYPNMHPLTLFVRRFFEETGVPVLYINACESRGEDTAALFAGKYEQSHEASIVLAAMHLLGLGHLYSEKEMARDEHMPPYPESYTKLRRGKAMVGYFMQEPKQHACPSPYVSLERGLEFIRKEVVRVAALMPALDQYAKDVQKQKNTGSWRCNCASAGAPKGRGPAKRPIRRR